MHYGKKILFVILILGLGFSFPRLASAEMWPDLIGNAFGSSLNELYKQIGGMIMGAAKQAAVSAIESQVSSLISGGSSGSQGALFITNPNQFLFLEPKNKARVMMDDFFTFTTRGTNSAVNYVSNSASGNMGSYTSYLVQQAKQSIDGTVSQNDLSQYTTDPSDLFGQGNWRAFSAYISNPANNPYGFTLMTEQAYNNLVEQQQQEAMARYIAGRGYKDVESDGQTITPASTVESIYNQVLDTGNKVLAQAQTLPELITATVTRMITSKLTQGIGNIQSNLNKELRL
jgi:hypothetical protein